MGQQSDKTLLYCTDDELLIVLNIIIAIRAGRPMNKLLITFGHKAIIGDLTQCGQPKQSYGKFARRP